MLGKSSALFLVVMLFLFVSCGGGATKQTESPTPSPEPSPSKSPPAGEKVTIDSADGAVIVGTFYAPSKKDSPGLLLLHQWRSDRHSWDDFASKLHDAGFGVLSIDGRGFGESVRTKSGATIAPERTDEAVDQMLVDVSNAFVFLSKQKDVDPKRLGVVGASYGSSLAIIFAGANKDVKAVALLSPGLNYFGNMKTEPAVREYGSRPLFAVASRDDSESAKTVEAFEKVAGSVSGDTFKVYSGSSHGTNIFGTQKDLEGELIQFFTKNL